MVRYEKTQIVTMVPARRKCVYAGSFDPVTMGHMWMIREGAKLFDEFYVAVGINPGKRYTFNIEERMELLRECTRGIGNLQISSFENQFLVHFAASIGAQYILRGIRNAHDYDFEEGMRQINADLNPKVTTAFLIPPRDLAEISSSFVKGLVGPEGWRDVVKKYLPAPTYKAFIERAKMGKGFTPQTDSGPGGLKDMADS